MGVFVENEMMFDELLELKMKTKKLRPLSKSTFDICLATEKLMERYNYKSEKYNHLTDECLSILNYDELFSDSNFDDHPELNHKKT